MITEEQVRAVLQYVFDPEIRINIVDLGLVYGIEIEPNTVHIQLTMTSPACPLHSVISRNVEQVLRQAFPVLRSVEIEMVWDPPWSPERMAESAKQQLGW